MDVGQLMSWLTAIVGLTGFYFSGRKVWWAWYVNLFCQALWITFALVTGYLAFLVSAAAYSIIFGLNAYRWTKEHYKPKYESNLVKHARVELQRIGEEPDNIDAYLKVVQAFADMGHSGSSAAFATPVIERLLQFKPLTPLTSDPDEWFFHGADVWGEEGGVWQNKRDSRMFSKDAGYTYKSVDDQKDEDGWSQTYCSVVVNDAHV